MSGDIFLFTIISPVEARFSKDFLHWLFPLVHFLPCLKPDNLVLAILASLKLPSLGKTLFLLRPADSFPPLSKAIPLWYLTLLSLSCFLALCSLRHHNSFLSTSFHLSECCCSDGLKGPSSSAAPSNVGDLWSFHLGSLLTPQTSHHGRSPILPRNI